MKIAIIGGGISGLSLAFFLIRKKPDLDVTVYESENRVGGKIYTDHSNGYLLETAVNGFLDNKPKTLDLANMMELTPLRSNDEARKRFLFSKGMLHRLPESPVSFFTSDLLSIKGRLRILYELFAPKGKDSDETLSTFAVRRLGKEAFEKLIDPMASGIYAGDPEQLSLKSCFPRIYNLESRYGSLIRGMLNMQREAKKSGKSVSAGPGGTLTSFDHGMGSFIDRLEVLLEGKIEKGCSTLHIEPVKDEWHVSFENNSSVNADAVVLATPGYVAGSILSDYDKGISEWLNRIPYPAVTVVCMGFKRKAIGCGLNGFGFLVPGREGLKILGTLWDSDIFPNRAPDGHVLLRSMTGGARSSDFAMQTEERIASGVLDELRVIMALKGEPELLKIYRHERAIPQYNRGHQDILEKVDAFMEKNHGLWLHGNAYRGIGFNDCIDNSFKLADRIVSVMFGEK